MIFLFQCQTATNLTHWCLRGRMEIYLGGMEINFQSFQNRVQQFSKVFRNFDDSLETDQSVPGLSRGSGNIRFFLKQLLIHFCVPMHINSDYKNFPSITA